MDNPAFLFQEAWAEMDDELRDALKELDADKNIKDDEFTAKQAMGIWRPSLSGTKRYIARLVDEGALTVRKAYDPEARVNVNAYRKVE
jgi:hypothetical protein